MESQLEFAENITYDNRNVVSGYPLRYNGLKSVQGSITELGDALNTVTFEISPINWYANNTCFNLSRILPRVAAGTVNCMLKIPPIDKIKISSRSSKTAIEISHLFRLACNKYFKSDENGKPGDVNSFRTNVHMNASTTDDLECHDSFNLAEYVGAFFNTKNIIPLTEVFQIEITFVPKDLVTYSFTKNHGTADIKRDYALSAYYNAYIKSNNAFTNAPQPIVLSDDNTLEGTEIIAKLPNPIRITNCSLVYEQERNPVVDLALKNLVINSKEFVVPYINCVPFSQTFNNSSNSYTMSLRLTNNIGSKLKRVVFTTSLANDATSLTKLGTYNSSHLGSAKIDSVFFDIGGRNIASYGVSNYDYLSRRGYKYDMDNQIDYVLEKEGNVVNLANTAASMNINPGRFRALPRNTFMIDIPFESVENDDMFSSNSGVSLNGDEVLNITLNTNKPIDDGLGGIRMTCFMYGIKFMKIMPNQVDFI